MRRGLTALVALAMGCASAAPPPGGPEDLAPPRLVRVGPDSGALNFSSKNASFYFDETINDRGSGAQEVDNYFLVSPSDGLPRVEWHRSRIDVRPRNGFRPNTAYSITLLPGLSDLRNNAMKTGRSIVFSTGPTIPTTRIEGTTFDWVQERPLAGAFLEAVTPDSIRYLAQSDSVGRFAVGPLPAGTYLVRAYIDQNHNRSLDRNEAFDTLRVTVPQAAPAELLVAARDTLPGRIATIVVVDSVTLRVNFTNLLDPSITPAASDFRLIGGPDSVLVAVASVRTAPQEAAAALAAQQAAADSARKADTSHRAAAVPPAAVPVPPTKSDDTLATRKPSRQPPFNSVTLKLARPLTPNTTYRLSTRGLRALSGRTAPSEAGFTSPRAVPKVRADSVAAALRDAAAARKGALPLPPDSARRLPPSRPPARP